ncbi:OmpA/MotB family protein [Limnovirga soli]|jgi:chemotaxis protein MotB|uniref:OmpA family protein n=1 Tax=Limnovirga soli TaxID=2656915 RepID=A0A8J8FE69_9BACT|nr:OmpA family protein [Limnovirga soli]NNV56441.1 OmpA family protein [Limnovirga soli]
MRNKQWLLAVLPFFLFSCVSTKKFKDAEAKNAEITSKYSTLLGEYNDCMKQKTDLNTQKATTDNDNSNLRNQIADLQKQNDFLKQNSTTMLNQLESLSVLSNSQAESVKKSLESLGAKDMYIQNLQSSMAKKDSLNMALVMNLKGAIGNLDDQDINIKVDKGVVYIDISDKLLFKSGSYDITDKASVVLGKVATVLKNQPDIEFMVEGHTDNVAYKGSGDLIDNWDLSVKRATSVVRILQNKYGITPSKMTAAGRGEYVPLTGNGSAQDRAANRRTRIVILPQLDQFFKLLEQPK